MEELWIAGMRQKIKDCNIELKREKLRELCRQLRSISPADDIAREYEEKLKIRREKIQRRRLALFRCLGKSLTPTVDPLLKNTFLSGIEFTALDALSDKTDLWSTGFFSAKIFLHHWEKAVFRDIV